jgi:hypothetical protein
MKLYKVEGNGSRDELQECKFNSHKKCLSYAIPITDAVKSSISYQLQLKEIPTRITAFYADLCSDMESEFKFQTLLYAMAPNGSHYANFLGLKTLPEYDSFYIYFEVAYEDNSIERFFSQDFVKERCSVVNLIEACYSENDNAGYDSDGNYLGLPMMPIFGNAYLRYYHMYPVRELTTMYQGKTLTYKTLNYGSKVVKTTSETTYQISYEVLPYWYDEEVSKAFEKGVVTALDKQYILKEFKAEVVGDPTCSRVYNTVLASEIKNISMSCGTTECQTFFCTPTSFSHTMLSVCLDAHEPYSQEVTVEGLHPIALNSITNNTGASINVVGYLEDGNYIDFQSLTISNPTTAGTIVIDYEDCNGTAQKTIYISEGDCCWLGDLVQLNS